MRLFGSTATTTPLVLRRVDGASAALERTISSSTTFSASPYSPGLAALSHILCRPITACPRKHHVVRHNYTDPQLRCAVAIPAATLFEKSVREHALSSSIPPPDWPCMKPRRLQHQLPIPEEVAMNSIREIERLNQRELDAAVPTSASWHNDWNDTAYVYIGGLPYELSEGDIITIFSQFGEPVHVNLIRDKDTGKSKGFAFLKYEDQRSTVLAVDNLGGTNILGRTIRVDHTRYKPKEGDGTEEMETRKQSR